MINRVLIRIKVVQLLYSYLLIENHFMLESQPSAPTKEKRFAYSLYLDILWLIVRLSNAIVKRGGYKPLADTRFIKKILADEKIKSLQIKYEREPFQFAGLVDSLADQISESALYKRYMKDQGTDKGDDDQIWEKIMKLIVFPNPALNQAFTTRENYTLRGVERMQEMLKETFKKFYASRDNLDEALQTLKESMEKAEELYYRLLLLPVELVRMREDQLEDNRNKYLPTDEDLNPNLRFVENALVRDIAENPTFVEYCEKHQLSWIADDRVMMESLLKKILESETYEEYMSFPMTDMQTDCDLWRNVFKQIIFHDEDFLDTMETKSVFWNDDLDIIGTFVLKTIRRFENWDGVSDPILPPYKDDEDESFGRLLFSDVVRNKDVYRRYIDDCIDASHWDSERLAFMDVIVAMTALAEIINFPKIPLVVSFNEYIEIAKSYSTSKSGGFVNGLLYTITNRLIDEGIIHKNLDM